MQDCAIRRWILPFILASQGSQLTEWPGPGCQAGGEREEGIARQDKLLGVTNAWDAKVCQKEQRHVKVSKVCKIREKIV